MPIPFSFRQLEYFVAVAERGSITQAAQHCHVSQPSVSSAISDLERVLGRKLFRRQTGHKLTITAAGRQLLIDARTTLAAAYSINADRGATAGEIGVACFKDLGAIYLPRLLADFSGSRGDVDFRIFEGDLVETQNHILDGRCELAITYDTSLTEVGLKGTVIDQLFPHVLLARSHPLSVREFIRLDELVSDRVILENFPSTIAFFLPLLEKCGLGRQNFRFVPSFEMQRSLIANGWGVGLSYARPVPDHAYDGAELVCLPLASDEPALNVVLAHLGEQTLSRTARAFLQFVKGLPSPHL